MTNIYVNGLHPAQHRPSECRTHRQLAGPERRYSQGLAELDALNVLPDIQLPGASVTSPKQFRPAFYYRDIAGLRRRAVAEIVARCEGSTAASRRHRGRQRL
ncbi:hypothetical protein [Mycobacterium paraseoulense]|nr:hypothetical protein [Mycobacterium paraseoulense]MCV7395022.1 hypothetical protein [Mycobacterium paraseoulense]